MYPTPLSLGRRIVKLSPEIWVVHGERPTQWLGFTIIYWVTYPIPSSSMYIWMSVCVYMPVWVHGTTYAWAYGCNYVWLNVFLRLCNTYVSHGTEGVSPFI